jgi:hypothetical protein
VARSFHYKLQRCCNDTTFPIDYYTGLAYEYLNQQKLLLTWTDDLEIDMYIVSTHNGTLTVPFQIYLVKNKLQPGFAVITHSNCKRKSRIPGYLTKKETNSILEHQACGVAFTEKVDSAQGFWFRRMHITAGPRMIYLPCNME